jgi:hypothetical protein
MSKSLIILTGLIYFGIGIDQFIKGNIPMAGLYFCYAAANIFMCMAVS